MIDTNFKIITFKILLLNEYRYPKRKKIVF